MTAWAILLIIALDGPADGEITGKIVFPGMDACRAAIRSISDAVPYDHKIECVETGIVRSISPKRRPAR